MKQDTQSEPRKRSYERAVKSSISMPGLLHDKAKNKSRQRGFSTFSDYIQDLIRKDTDSSFAA